jgi:hypothetical protein
MPVHTPPLRWDRQYQQGESVRSDTEQDQNR